MFCVVGLGNPGLEYQRNRHNIGFMATDEIIRRFAIGTIFKNIVPNFLNAKLGTQNSSPKSP